MAALVKESSAETADELIADWERVLLEAEYPDMDINARRTQLKSKQDVRLNKSELQKIAALYGFLILSITFPYRPAFFGHSRFNRRAGGYSAFSVLLFTVTNENLFFNCWQIAKAELENKRFARMRFGIDRMAHFPIRRRRELVFSRIRKTGFGFARFGTGRLFPLGKEKITEAVRQELKKGRFARTRFGTERVIDFDGNSRSDLVSNYSFYDDYANGILENARFAFRFESAIVNYAIKRRKLFSEFEAAIKAKPLASQMPIFCYEGD
jgi:hypothetical protein